MAEKNIQSLNLLNLAGISHKLYGQRILVNALRNFFR